MKTTIRKILTWQATRVLQQYKPTVIAITGSVGKTSTRNAITAVLMNRFRVRTAPIHSNYNNEWGVPLTILGADQSPGRSVFGWLSVLMRGAKLLVGHDESYPNVLVLEFGADRPGDMAALCDIAPPNIAVFTSISPVHLSNYPNMEALIEEEATNVLRVSSSGLTVLNADDATVLGFRSRSAAPVMTYGFAPSADVRAQNMRVQTRDDYSFEPGEKFSETQFTLATAHRQLDVVLPNMLGSASVSCALAAAAVATHMGVSLDEVAERLLHVMPAPGRLRPIAGIKGSLLLDDSYNAAPASMAAALEALSRFQPTEGARRIAALGSMAELGPLTEEEHRKLGFDVVARGVDLLVTVGEAAQGIRDAAVEAGLATDCAEHFPTSVEAGRYLDRVVKKGDIVLVKGSQSARMEKVTKDLMAEPLFAEQLLVRQYGKWLEE